MKQTLLGVKIDDLIKEQWLKAIVSLVHSGKQGEYLVRPNAEIITYAQKDPEFKNILNNAALAIPDGVGVETAAKILNLRLNNRCGGPESMLDIVKLAEEKSFSIYLLGGKVQTVAKAARNLQKKFENLRLVGYQSGYFTDSVQVANDINKVKPNIVFVGMGFPRQEKWIWENRDKLNVNLLVAEGGSFDYLAKEAKRAPVIIRKVGLDWLFRLILQPWRLKRQLSLFKFFYLVLKLKIVQGRALYKFWA